MLRNRKFAIRTVVWNKIQYLYHGLLGPLPHPEKWIFIVGCYNSGTTLLHELLALHPSIGSMPREGQNYTDELLLPKSLGLPRLWAIEPERFYLNEQKGHKINVNRLKRQWGAHFNDVTRAVLMERSPTNSGRTRWLQKHFNNAHFIGIVRNGYAVAEGIHRKEGHSLEIAAQQWVRSNEIMLQDFEFLKNKKLIRYESLTESTSDVLIDLFQFIGLTLPDFDVANKVFKIHKELSSVRNMNYRSFEALTAEEIKIINRVAGDMLSRLGYDSLAS
jgi:hypothetical protein